MNQPELPFEVMETTRTASTRAVSFDQLRIRRPVRNQVEMMARDLDSLVPEDHTVRGVWQFINRMDLSEFYGSIKAAVDRPGRPASDPQVLLALWVYASAEGISSSRTLDDLCKQHDAYRWLCGGVPVDYHTLSDFRVAHKEALDHLLTEILAVMMDKKLVTLKAVAQDGVRVRASAGAGSFHRLSHLEKCLCQAKEQIERLAQEREHPDPEVSARERSARERAARERAERINEALKELPAIQAAKDRQRRNSKKSLRPEVSEARASTTDAKVRVMKMPDGGWRPAYNVEFATDVGSGVIAGVGVINEGDSNQGPPMEAQVAQRSGGIHPEAYLIDGGFAQRDTITTLSEREVTVYAPVRPPRTTTSGRESKSPRCDDSPAVVAWRERMETDEAKQIYKERAATAEWTNAQARSHGLNSFSVRGLDKVLCVALLVAVAHNILRGIVLGA